MAHFKSTSGKAVACYGGTHCSGTVLAELTNESFITKARRNPDFTEVAEVVEPIVVEPVKPRKKRTTKKRVYKKKAK